MERLFTVLSCIVLCFVFLTQINAQDCVTSQDGTLLRSNGVLIDTGFDEWGYNYQAHMFNGKYCDAYRDAARCQEWKDVDLLMKWNNAWLSNKDCDDDGLLDRHWEFTSYLVEVHGVITIRNEPSLTTTLRSKDGNTLLN